MFQTKRLQLLLENLLFVWLGLALILSFAGNHLQIPDLLQVIGRAHPLLLHFPIVLILLGLLFFWIPNLKPEVREVGTYNLLIGSNFAGITVIAGLFLAQEGYEGSELTWHQWMGMAVYIISIVLYFYREKKKIFIKPVSLCLAGLVIITGHLGANLTHGDDFLLAPIKSQEKEQIQLADAQIFRDMVQPIFEAKCQSCHKDGKIKGELRLDTMEGIHKGGKSGPFAVAGNIKESLLTQRILLPKEEKEHMPPKNKEQLTDEEIEILTAWVMNGADYDRKVVDLEPENELFIFASEKFSKAKTYYFEAADEEDVADLNNFFRKINPIFPGSPALEVSYFGISAFDPKSLSDLKKIKDQVVKINLNKMPLEDVSLDFLSDFPNLEEIQLNFSDLSDSQLENLQKIEKLENLAISGNRISDSAIPSLVEIKNLKNLYAWQTDFTEAGKAELQEKLKGVFIDFGFDDTGLVYELNPPKLIFDDLLFQDSTLLEIKHPIKTVDIRYSLDETEPDSISGMKYTEPIWITQTSKISARVFGEGWLGSEPEKNLLFKSGIHPTEIKLLTDPAKKYSAQGGKTLNDQIKGKNTHTSGEWLGYQDEPADFIVNFPKSAKPERIVLSMLYNESGYIFPPTMAEVWVLEGENWKLVTKEVPRQSEEIEIPRFEALAFDLPKEPFDQIRVRLTPISKLPKWHPGAGEKGWVFIDEVLLED